MSIKYIKECLKYLLDSEYDDYIEQCVENGKKFSDIESHTHHVWANAALAYYDVEDLVKVKINLDVTEKEYHDAEANRNKD
jgi:hypothetical protein